MARKHLNGFQRLAVVTTALALGLVALGGAVRATDSGLACPDWPRCFGRWVPPADLHMWLEHSHRLLAGVVGIGILVLAVWAVARFRDRPAVLWPALAALVLVSAQAALGAVVVLRLLQAELVTAHLGMAMVVVACLVGLAFAASDAPAAPSSVAVRDRRLARTAVVVAGVCFLQILVGGHVTGIGAGLVYTDFPLMGGDVIPPVATQVEAFHVGHRLLAYLLAGGVVWLGLAATRARRGLVGAGAPSDAHRWLVRIPRWIGVLVVVQICLGVANLVTGASSLTVIPHLAVASWIWTLLVVQTLLAHRRVPAMLDEEPGPATPLAPREDVRA